MTQNTKGIGVSASLDGDSSDPRYVRSIALNNLGNFEKLRALVRATGVAWSENLSDRGVVVSYQINLASDAQIDVVLSAITQAGYTAYSTRTNLLGAPVYTPDENRWTEFAEFVECRKASKAQPAFCAVTDALTLVNGEYVCVPRKD